jgi:acetyl-CoA hydrolase
VVSLEYSGSPDRPVAAAGIDLTRYIRPGDTVAWGQACAEPLSLTRRMAEQRHLLGPLRCFLGATSGDGLVPGEADGLAFTAYCGAGANRDLERAARLEILPARYSDLPGLFETGAFGIDVVLVQVTPGDRPGAFRFSIAAEYLVAAARAARVVIAEVNDRAPSSPGAPELAVADIDAIVTASYRPAEQRTPAPGPAEEKVAVHVTSLIEDGATLQVGLGALPEAIVRRLDKHADLGVHSGTAGDAIADLMRAGVITNARKTLDRGTTVCGVLMGTRELLEFADGNPAIALRDTAYTHDPDVLASQRRLVAVNSAVEVDLTGQVNSEVAAGRYVGAAGGVLDFTRGASRSHGGIPIIALTSTAGSGETVSKIVPCLSGPATLPRSESLVVVTEYGVADLRGLTLSRRREKLIAIAHPDHRAALEAASPGPGEAAG